MVLYRRNRVKGGTYFFPVTLRDWSSSVLVQHVALLRHAFRKVRAERSFTMDAIVILPDHLHTLWTLPEGDADYSRGDVRPSNLNLPANYGQRECP
jgi:putative transposase